MSLYFFSSVRGGRAAGGGGGGLAPSEVNVTTLITVNTMAARIAECGNGVGELGCLNAWPPADDLLIALLVASHLACSISVFRSPSEMVNLLLIS